MGVGQEELKAAYRATMRQVHPDLHPGHADSTQAAQRVNEAYEVLSNPRRRAAYHRARAALKRSRAKPRVAKRVVPRPKRPPDPSAERGRRSSSANSGRAAVQRPGGGRGSGHTRRAPVWVAEGRALGPAQLMIYSAVVSGNTGPSTASISCNTSALKLTPEAAAFSSTCSGRVAPMIADATFACRRTQLSES